MAYYKFLEKEVNEIKKIFPELKFISPATWEGFIEFYVQYEETAIKDRYKIEIVISTEYPDQMPLMYEVGGRTQEIAKKYNITDLRDLHYNPNLRSACLCVKQEEKFKFPISSGLTEFINDLVIPYLYGLSFYDQYGRWPWGEYSHGPLGILEYYAENIKNEHKENPLSVIPFFKNDNKNKEIYKRQFINPKSKKNCVCGSNKPFSTCHPLAWSGLIQIHKDLRQLKLNITKLFSE